MMFWQLSVDLQDSVNRNGEVILSWTLSSNEAGNPLSGSCSSRISGLADSGKLREPSGPYILNLSFRTLLVYAQEAGQCA